MSLCKDDKLGHVRDTDDLPVHLCGEADRFLDLPTVYEPKPEEQKRSCEVEDMMATVWATVVDIGVRQNLLSVLPC